MLTLKDPLTSRIIPWHLQPVNKPFATHDVKCFWFLSWLSVCVQGRMKEQPKGMKVGVKHRVKHRQEFQSTFTPADLLFIAVARSVCPPQQSGLLCCKATVALPLVQAEPAFFPVSLLSTLNLHSSSSVQEASSGWRNKTRNKEKLKLLITKLQFKSGNVFFMLNCSYKKSFCISASQVDVGWD